MLYKAQFYEFCIKDFSSSFAQDLLCQPSLHCEPAPRKAMQDKALPHAA